MTYVRPATYAGLLYPVEYKTQIQQNLAQTRLRRQRQVRLIVAPHSSFSEALQVYCEAYSVIDPAQFDRIVILCSLGYRKTLQTPFSRFALPDRRCEIVEVQHAPNVDCASEIDCINCPQAELQLLFLSCVFTLASKEVYVIYAGSGLEVVAVQPLLIEATLIVVSAEFCRIGVAYGFLPKRDCGMRDYVIKRNEAFVQAISDAGSVQTGAQASAASPAPGGAVALADALRAINLENSSALLCAAKLFRAFKPLQLKILKQTLSATLEGKLDSSKSFCAVAGYEGEIRSWCDDVQDSARSARK